MSRSESSPVPPASHSARADHEREHGRHLAAVGAEDIWGWGTPAGQVRARRRAQMIAAGADLKPGMRVLEVGCGTGLFTELLSSSGAHIIAIDISPELLEIARARGLDPAKAQFVEGRFEEAELLGPFDAVIGSSVLHHLEIEPSLAKIRALLKPGGRMSFAEPNMLNPQIAVQKNVPWIKRKLGDSPDETAFVRWKIAAALGRNGFVNVRVQPFDWLHPITPRRLIGLVSRVGAVLERLPLAREFAGSVLISASASQQ